MNTTYAVGAINKIITLRAYNTADGSPYTGGAYNTLTIAAVYTRDGATAVTINLVSMTAGTYVSSGFVHRGKGLYELGAPALALASGADGVEFAIDGITGVVFIPTRVDLVGADPRSTTPPDVNLKSILTTNLTETVAGYLSAAFKKLFDVATPVFDMTSVKQTGDSYVRLGAPVGASISADIAEVATDTDSTLTKLGSPAGASLAADIAAAFARIGAPAGASIAADIAANLAAVGNISNLSSMANIFGPTVMEIPDSGTALMAFRVVFKDADGHLVDVDTNTVTLTIANSAGTSRAANLSAVTHPRTGVYDFTYTVTAGDTKESLRLTASATVASAAREANFGTAVEDYDTVTALTAIKAQTDKLVFSVANQLDVNVLDWKGATAPAMTGDAFARLGAPAGASHAADVAAVKADTGTTLARIPGTVPVASDWTSARAGKIDQLDQAVSAAKTLTPAERSAIADAHIVRSVKGGADSSPTMGEAASGGLLDFSINTTTGVMTVYKGDGVTVAYTRTLTRSGTALLAPISAL